MAKPKKTVEKMAGNSGCRKHNWRGWLASRGELVTEVLDGDSFKISNKQTIRLASLDAPAKDLCFGTEATKALTEKIMDKRVILNNLRTDRYGRIIAQVYVNGIHVNNFMIKNGFAESTRQAGEETANIKIANDYAREKKAGIFSPGCFQENPRTKNALSKVTSMTALPTKKYYFTPNCRHYSKVIVKKKFRGQLVLHRARSPKSRIYKSPQLQLINQITHRQFYFVSIFKNIKVCGQLPV